MRKKKTQPIPKRNILFHFCVDKEESELIMERMVITGMVSRTAFLRTMATKGYHITIDLSDVNETIRLLRNINNNLKQLSERAHEIRSIYAADIDELRRRYDSLWDTVNGILKGLAKIK